MGSINSVHIWLQHLNNQTTNISENITNTQKFPQNNVRRNENAKPIINAWEEPAMFEAPLTPADGLLAKPDGDITPEVFSSFSIFKIQCYQ